MAYFSLVSLSVYPRSRRGAERIRQGEERWSRPPKTALERSDLTEKFQFQESHTEVDPKKLLTKSLPPEKKSSHTIYMGVHGNLRTNPIDPSSPLQKLTRTITVIVSCILNSTLDVWFCPPQCGLYSFRAQNKAERLSPVDPGIGRGVTGLYPSSRGCTPRNTRDRSITRSLQS